MEVDVGCTAKLGVVADIAENVLDGARIGEAGASPGRDDDAHHDAGVGAALRGPVPPRRVVERPGNQVAVVVVELSTTHHSLGQS